MLEIVQFVCLNIWEPTSKRRPCDSPIWCLIIQKVQFFTFFFPNLISIKYRCFVFFKLSWLFFLFSGWVGPHHEESLELDSKIYFLTKSGNYNNFKFREGTNAEIWSFCQTPSLCTSNHPAHPPPKDTTVLENLTIHSSPHLHLRELIIRMTTRGCSSQKNLNIEVILCVWSNQSHVSAVGSFSFLGFQSDHAVADSGLKWPWQEFTRIVNKWSRMLYSSIAWYQSALLGVHSKHPASQWVIWAMTGIKDSLSLLDRALILMFFLLTPNTTIFFLILSGFLKITAPLRERAYLSIHIKDRCPRRSNTLSVNNGWKLGNFWSSLSAVSLFCGQMCLECIKGMLIKPYVKMPGDQLHLWAALQLSHFPRIPLLKHGYGTDFFSTPMK